MSVLRVNFQKTPRFQLVRKGNTRPCLTLARFAKLESNTFQLGKDLWSVVPLLAIVVENGS